MKTARKFVFYMALAGALSAVATGCGKVSLDIGNLNSGPSAVVQLNQGAEFVASSGQGQPTYKGYHVDTSAGSSFGGLQTTTLNGYKVYSSLQGQMISEDISTSSSQAAR